jgi:hypothetical protein
MKLILNQNYFQYKENVYKLKIGVAVGIIAGIFIQNLECPLLKQFLESETVIYYTRFVDSIFIIYNQNRITSKSILVHFSKQHKAL